MKPRLFVPLALIVWIGLAVGIVLATWEPFGNMIESFGSRPIPIVTVIYWPSMVPIAAIGATIGLAVLLVVYHLVRSLLPTRPVPPAQYGPRTSSASDTNLYWSIALLALTAIDTVIGAAIAGLIGATIGAVASFVASAFFLWEANNRMHVLEERTRPKTRHEESVEWDDHVRRHVSDEIATGHRGGLGLF
jgi:predicted lysophospholipase L1 biosynthesis ABC-type transport system permease subunit